MPAASTTSSMTRPVQLREFLPLMASLLGEPEPQRMEESAAREKFGDLRVYYWNEQRAASNTKAKRELDWQPMFPVWRTGFQALYSAPGHSGAN